MTESSVPLTVLSEDQRAQAHTRFTIIRPALEDGVSQAQVARTNLAMDGLQILAVTMTDVKQCELPLRANSLLNEAVFFRHRRCPNL